MKRTVIVVVAMSVVATACSSTKSHSTAGSTPAAGTSAAAVSASTAAQPAPTSAAAGKAAAGSLVISGAVTATIAEEPVSGGNVECGPSGVGTVNGQIAFGPQGPGGYLLSVTGGPGSFTLPRASGPSVLLVQTGGAGRWGGLTAPASGMFSMTGTTQGSIRGNVNATLVSVVPGTTTQVHVTGTWQC
ncbi:MAG TPA: hypothetical protein VK662_16550 [Acidothermaceae bacterium]|jgi:hypothetical protein|nr:hypothetical protein [Acidothermaceae bacterium]